MYLMIKEHCDTGLKYLCKHTTNNIQTCYKYHGSGKYWKRHLAKHGDKVKTTILECCSSREEFITKGIEWSEKLDVVKSSNWANLVPERGDGGPTMLGRKLTREQNRKKGDSHKRWWRNATTQQKEWRCKRNKEGHEKYVYKTPLGIFKNAYEAAKAHKCSNVTIINRCTKNDTPIESRKYWSFSWRGKTWKDLGYERLDA